MSLEKLIKSADVANEDELCEGKFSTMGDP